MATGGVSFTVGGVSFGQLDGSTGRKALYMDVGAEQHQIIQFHPPGTNGNLLIFNGRIAMPITFMARYVGAVSSILDDFKSDKDAWTGVPVSITDDAGDQYDRCILVSAQRVGRGLKGLRGDGRACFDIMAVFDWKG